MDDFYLPFVVARAQRSAAPAVRRRPMAAMSAKTTTGVRAMIASRAKRRLRRLRQSSVEDWKPQPDRCDSDGNTYTSVVVPSSCRVERGSTERELVVRSSDENWKGILIYYNILRYRMIYENSYTDL